MILVEDLSRGYPCGHHTTAEAIGVWEAEDFPGMVIDVYRCDRCSVEFGVRNPS